MSTLATLVVKIVGDASNFERVTQEASKNADGLVSNLNKNMRIVGAGALAAGGAIIGSIGGALAVIGPKAINAASDFSESFSKVNVVFGDSAGVVTSFAETTATQLGIAEQDALAAAGTFGNLFRTMGLGSDTSAGMSTDLVTLAADLASFNNLDPTEVLDKLRSGLVGETEPLRSLGINLTDAAVRTQAVAMGLAATTTEVDQAAMTQARFALIMEQSALAQGDFARTSDGLANSQRILGAIWQDVLQKVGSVALPILTGALLIFLGFLTDTALPALDKVVTAFEDFRRMTEAGINPLSALRVILDRFLPPDVSTKIVGAIRSIIDGIQGLIAQVAPYVKQAAAWIGEHVKLQDVLIAVGLAIAAVVIPAIGSLVAAVAPVIATFVAVIAIVAALRTAWETDFLGIRTALEAAWAVIVPAFEKFFGFLKNDWWPLLNTVANFLGTAFSLAAEIAAGVWQNVLYPAFKKIADVVMSLVQPALDKLTPFLDRVGGGIGGISEAVQKLIGWFESLTGKLETITLPDWMTPGSPTPLEIGLLGIRDAMRDLTQMEMPGLSAGFSQMTAPEAVSSGTAQRSPVTIYGLTLDGVQNADDLLGQLQGLATG